MTWIGHQREAYKTGKLSNMRTKKLNGLGFQWVAASWGEMYSKLVRYYEAHGDPNVPPNWPPDPALAHWVHDQRMKHKKGKLSDTHRAQLQQVSLCFYPGPPPRRRVLLFPGLPRPRVDLHRDKGSIFSLPTPCLSLASLLSSPILCPFQLSWVSCNWI